MQYATSSHAVTLSPIFVQKKHQFPQNCSEVALIQEILPTPSFSLPISVGLWLS